MNRIAVGLLLIALTSCHRTQNTSDVSADHALREFLGVHALTGVYKIPAHEAGYLVTLLEFTDGKLTERGLSSYGSTEHLASRTLRAQVLWGSPAGSAKVQLALPGMAVSSNHAFWSKLDGGSASIGSDIEPQSYEGFVILGFAESDLTRDGRTNTASGGSFRHAVELKKFVGALAVKSFKSPEEAQKAALP